MLLCYSPESKNELYFLHDTNTSAYITKAETEKSLK